MVDVRLIRKDLNYDITNEKSILSRARKLHGKTVSDVINASPYDKTNINVRNKGNVGNIIEQHWFGIENNSTPEPDFEDAGIELKVVPLKRDAKNSLVVKERTKICSIDYKKLYDETWPTSHAKRKLNKVLFVFYEYNPIDITSSQVKKISLWSLIGNDEVIIRTDWNKVHSKVAEGLAHQLSETLSKVLAASRSGSGGKKNDGTPKDEVKQPITEYTGVALKRAFSLKSSFTNQYWGYLKSPKSYESIIETANITNFDNYESQVLKLINQHQGKTIKNITESFDIKVTNSKSAIANIIKKAIGFKNVKSKFKEFNQLGIELKTVPVRSSDDRPWESTSFPAFKLQEFIKEEWSNSTLNDLLYRILFIPVYRDERDTPLQDRILGESFFWSPNKAELEIIINEWVTYQQEVNAGKCAVTKVPHGDDYREITDLSKESQTEIIHIRPHGQNRMDRDTDHLGNSLVKQSFWLNKGFVQKLLIQNK